MKSFFKKLFFKLKKLLWPREFIAGLEIKDAAVRIARFIPEEERGRDGTALKKASVALEPGVIENGKIKDNGQFVSALKKLRQEFTSSGGEILVIASIPSSNVYTQVFSLPSLLEPQLKEAAELNLKSLSPLEAGASYSDWQKVGLQENKAEILGAFAPSAAVDEFVAALKEAGFIAVSVEFPALALSRALGQFASGLDFQKPQVAVSVSSDGIDFLVLRQGNLYFSYFVPWKLIQENGESRREILFSDFKDTILGEIKKVSTFYGSHWEGRLEKIILITHALNKEITGFIQSNFNFQVVEPKLSDFSGLQPSWFGVLGSAIRGQLPRSEDTLISLTALGTEKEYLQSQIKIFVKLWRNVFAVTLVFFILVFVLADSLLFRTSFTLAKQLQELITAPKGAEVAILQEQAANFNKIVEKASFAKEQSVPWSPTVAKIFSLIPRNVTLVRLSLNRQQSSVLLAGRSEDESAAIALKNALIKEGFKGASLPLSNIVSNPDKTVSFTISFQF